MKAVVYAPSFNRTCVVFLWLMNQHPEIFSMLGSLKMPQINEYYYIDFRSNNIEVKYCWHNYKLKPIRTGPAPAELHDIYLFVHASSFNLKNSFFIHRHIRHTQQTRDTELRPLPSCDKCPVVFISRRGKFGLITTSFLNVF
jgi:hypothetical protein